MKNSLTRFTKHRGRTVPTMKKKPKPTQKQRIETLTQKADAKQARLRPRTRKLLTETIVWARDVDSEAERGTFEGMRRAQELFEFNRLALITRMVKLEGELAYYQSLCRPL